MADASTTASTGTPKCCARSAALGVPSNRPITPSMRMRSLLCAAACRRWRQSASPFIHRSSWCTGWPLASWCQCGSKKSGPHLNTCTRRPRRVCNRASAAVTVVLPCPEAGAAISKAGQRAAGCVMAFQGDGVVTGEPTSGPQTACGRAWHRCGPTGSPCRPDCPRGPAGCSRAQCGCWRTG